MLVLCIGAIESLPSIRDRDSYLPVLELEFRNCF